MPTLYSSGGCPVPAPAGAFCDPSELSEAYRSDVKARLCSAGHKLVQRVSNRLAAKGALGPSRFIHKLADVDNL